MTRLFLKLGLLVFLCSCQSEKSSTYDDLFSEYFEVFPNIIQPIQPDLAATSVKEQAFKLYNSGQYDQARVLFETLRVQHAEPAVDFYHGISLIKLNQPQEALKLFRSIPASSQFFHHAQWYAALAHLQTGEAERSKAILQSISEKPGMIYNREKAVELLKRIDN
jgi:tetratricopeptide (TPR) repeat protein